MQGVRELLAGDAESVSSFFEGQPLVEGGIDGDADRGVDAGVSALRRLYVRQQIWPRNKHVASGIS